MPAPVWQSTTALAGGNGASAVITLPGSIAAGDVVVLQVYKENAAACTPPSGFAEKISVSTTVNVHSQHIFWKRMVGGESGTVTVSWAGSVFRSGRAHRISGCATSGDPWNTDVTTNFSDVVAGGTTLPAVSLASTPADSLLFWGATDFAGSTTVWTPPTGFTLQGSDIVMAGGTKDNTAGGATGTLTGSVNTGADTMTAFLGALSSPAPAPIVAPSVIAQLTRPL